MVIVAGVGQYMSAPGQSYSVAAFKDPGQVQDSVKMGALLSFAAAPLAIIIGRVLGIRPLKTVAHDEPEASHQAA